jgi:hypothetical protein
MMRTWQRCFGALVAWTMLLAFDPVAAQERFSLFVGSAPATVDRMVRMAGLRDGETVMDLGSGDGRIVFAAAQSNGTVRGIGVDIDGRLVAQSNEQAEKLNVADRVSFLHQNAFDADLSKVDVIFMWFFPELMRLLRVKILEQARPGTRVVAALWGFGSWQPDASETESPEVHMWIVPAKVGGYWNWQLDIAGHKLDYAAVFEQQFQKVEGVVRAQSRHGIFHDFSLRGREISFVLMMTLPDLGFTRHEFTGRVNGDAMEGVVKITLPPKPDEEEDEKLDTRVLPWKAQRVPTSPFFAPVGIPIFDRK